MAIADTTAPTVDLTYSVSATPAQVYYAFTNPTALREWMCDGAYVEARKNGALLLAWNAGFYAAGVYQTLTPNELIRFTWQGRGDPGETWVEIRLEAADSGTKLTLAHGGLGSGAAWEHIPRQFRDNWQSSLNNLKSVLEDGLDVRISNRPMLGIMPIPLGPDLAQRAGVPVSDGLYLDGIVLGLGAEAAGLQSGDVLVTLDGKPVSDMASLAAAVGSHQAGDTVAVEYYRRQEKRSAVMTLSKRPTPEVPADPRDLAARLTDSHDRLNAELDTLLKDVTETEAAYHPAPGEWNVNENLAHLIATERHSHVWIWNFAGGDDRVPWADNNPTHLLMALAVHPSTPELVAELKRAQFATAAMIEALPPAFVARKLSYRRLGAGLLGLADHTREHFRQMQAAIEAARRA